MTFVTALPGALKHLAAVSTPANREKPGRSGAKEEEESQSERILKFS